MTRADVAPPGMENVVKALKSKPGVENPYAVSWAMYEEGEDEAEMMDGDEEECEDAATYLSAGAKAGPSGDDYEKKTQSLEPFMTENEDTREMDDAKKEADDDEKLLDDADEMENDDDAANYPKGQEPAKDPPAGGTSIGVHGSISDPEPEVAGISAFSFDDAEPDEDDDFGY